MQAQETPKLCPKCGKPMKKMNFRTGSLSLPSTEVDTCAECSTTEPSQPPPSKKSS